MKRNYASINIVLFVVLIFTSCNSKKTNNYQTYIVQNKIFENSIIVSGIIESNKVFSVQGPGLHADLTISDMVPEGSFVHKGDTVCYLQCNEIVNQYNEALNRLELAKSEYEKLHAIQNMDDELLNAQISNIKAQTSISELDTLSFKFYSPLKLRLAKLELQRAYNEKDKIEKKKSFGKRVKDANISSLQLRIKMQEASVQNAQSNILKLKLISQADGYIKYVDYLWSTGSKAKVGDMIWGRMPIMDVSDLSSLQVKLVVNESHFKRIEKDQKIDIHLDAYPDIKLTGKITFKSPAGKPIKEHSTLKVFEVTGSIDSLKYKIQPGVSATCKVNLAYVKNTILVPLTSVFDSDSLKVVYILAKNGNIKKMPVTTGMSSDKEIIIEKGLKRNEVILLTEPSDKFLQ